MEENTLNQPCASQDQGSNNKVGDTPMRDGTTSKSTKKKWDPKKHFKQKTGFESNSRAKYPKLNHIQWYVLNKAMMDDIGSYPYGYPVGETISENDVKMQTAGIAVLKYCPCIPGNGEAWRMAATRFETTVRAKNSRSATYSGNDLLMSQSCYASVYSAYAYIAKHFGLIKFFSYKNNYLTQRLVTSLGCDYADLVRNQANYREEVNQLGRDLMSLLFIKGMTLFDRWAFLNLNLFTDTDSAKTQIYQFKPTCVWKWTPRTSDLGSSLTGVRIPEKYKLEDLITLVRGCIDSLRGDDDIKYMNADIAKAYPNNDVIVVKPIDESFAIELYGNTNIKDQIQNARIIDIVKTNVVPTDITNSAQVTFEFENYPGNANTTKYLNALPNPNTIITTDDVDPTSEDTIVKSRFMNTFILSLVPESTLIVQSGSGGSEIISSIEYINDARDSSKSLEMVSNGMYAIRNADGSVKDINAIAVSDVVRLSAFRWHSFITVPDEVELSGYLREYPTDNFTVLGTSNLDKMNNAIAVAMLNIAPASNTGVSDL